MISILKKSDVRKILPKRKPESHKGENGKVLIVGGSLEFFGAPVLSGLGALYSGADLVYLLVPECNFDVSRSFYPDFIVHSYGGNRLNARALDALNPLLEICDCVVIGPGLTKEEDVLTNVKKLLRKIEKPIVIDADALHIVPDFDFSEKNIVLTPHRGEFYELTGELKTDEPPPKELFADVLKKYAAKWNACILLKGPQDFIAAPRGDIFMNETGNAGMTVGGTGDVLAGMVASFIAQGLKSFEACCCAAFINGLAGDNLARQKAFAFSATDLALELPYTINQLF